MLLVLTKWNAECEIGYVVGHLAPRRDPFRESRLLSSCTQFLLHS